MRFFNSSYLLSVRIQRLLLCEKKSSQRETWAHFAFLCFERLFFFVKKRFFVDFLSGKVDFKLICVIFKSTFKFLKSVYVPEHVLILPLLAIIFSDVSPINSRKCQTGNTTRRTSI